MYNGGAARNGLGNAAVIAIMALASDIPVGFALYMIIMAITNHRSAFLAFWLGAAIGYTLCLIGVVALKYFGRPHKVAHWNEITRLKD